MIARIVCVLLFAGVIGISVWMIRDAILWVRGCAQQEGTRLTSRARRHLLRGVAGSARGAIGMGRPTVTNTKETTVAFEHIPRPSRTNETDAEAIQALEALLGRLVDTSRNLRYLNVKLHEDLASKQAAFDEAQSRYESLYQTHREADVITAAIRRIVARVPDRALAIWRDDYGYAASHGSTEGIANGETLEDALTNLDARLAFVRNEDRPSVQNECAPTRDTPHQESDLKLRPIDAFEVVDMRGIAALQRRWVKSMPWRDKTPLEALALIASEIGEAVNECRGDTPTAELGTELADIVLRTFDLAEMLGIDMDSECRQKMAHNIEKGNLKGRGV